MNPLVEQALTAWGMEGASYELVAARENAVFKISTDTDCFALRLHRKGYRTNAELWSELKWMEAVAKGGMAVPTPIASATGDALHTIDDVQIDVLTWLDGVPLGDIIGDMSTTDRSALFNRIGHEMARLHDICDAWSPPDGFSRWDWDRNGLLGETPLWDRFWDNPTLSEKNRLLFLQVREKVAADLAQMEGSLDYGLIHADLVGANIMADGCKLYLIDFDDGGFGFRLFEIATVMLKFAEDDDYPMLRNALIEGYTDVRGIDFAALDLFVLIRSVTYVGWIITRLDEEGSDVRNERFISMASRLAENYLTSRT